MLRNEMSLMIVWLKIVKKNHSRYSNTEIRTMDSVHLFKERILEEPEFQFWYRFSVINIDILNRFLSSCLRARLASVEKLPAISVQSFNLNTLREFVQIAWRCQVTNYVTSHLVHDYTQEERHCHWIKSHLYEHCILPEAC